MQKALGKVLPNNKKDVVVYLCLTHTWSSQGQSVVQSSGFSGNEQIAKHTESYDER